MIDVAQANQEESGIEKAVAAVYCRHLLGPGGVVAVSILVMCSTFISLNGWDGRPRPSSGEKITRAILLLIGVGRTD